MRVSFLIPIMAALLSRAIGVAQAPATEAPPHFSAEMYNPASAPVRVINWAYQGNDILASVGLANIDSKPVRAITFRWIAETPAACSSTQAAVAQESGVIGPFDLDLLPDHARHIHSLGLWREMLDVVASTQGREYTELQIVPTQVIFADGSVWKHDVSALSSYDPESVEKLSSQCQSLRLSSPSGSSATQKEETRPLISASSPSPCSSDGDCGGGGATCLPVVWDDDQSDAAFQPNGVCTTNCINPVTGPSCGANTDRQQVCTNIKNGCQVTGGCTTQQISANQCNGAVCGN